MTDTAALEEILSKFSGNKIDSKEFLNLLLTSDENGIDYLQNLKKEFKENYVNPVFKKATDHYKKLDKVLNDEKTKKEIEEKISDPLDVISLNKEYREKTKKILDKKLKDLSDNLKMDADNQASDKINSSVLSSVLPKTQQPINEEQKTFTPKENVVSLSDTTINKLVDIFGGISSKVLKGENSTEESSSGGGLLASIGKFLLVGGVAAGLISMFWSSHIKPWLEEKIGVKLDILDKFEGTLEGISKFFTMGGLKITGGWLFNIVGKAFTTFGELLEGSLNAIFKLGFGDDVVREGAKAAPAVWKTLLPKVAGGLFKGVGLASLKAIPIIGGLISFYFAKDRFDKGDNIGGIIDIINGIVGFVPGFGIPLSLGLSALNAFLDYKAGDIKDIGSQQSMKMDYVSKLTKFVKEIPFIGGLISGLMGLYKLGTSNNINDIKNALDDMEAVPIFGILPSIIRSVLDVTFNDEGEWQGYDFSKVIKNIKTNMLKTVLKWFPTWFGIRSEIANLMGIDLEGEYLEDPFDLKNTYDETSSIMSKSENVKKTTEDFKKQEDILKLQQEINTTKEELKSTLEKYNKNTVPEYEKLNTGTTGILANSKSATDFFRFIGGGGRQYYENQAISSKMEAETEYIKTLQEKIKILESKINETSYVEETIENPQNFTPISKQDFSFNNLMNTAQGSILFDKSSNTANMLDKEDNILAYKKDGVFDVALQEITKLVSSINKGIYKIPESLENMPTQSPVVVSGGGGQSDDSMAYVLGGSRDAIYEFRRSFR